MWSDWAGFGMAGTDWSGREWKGQAGFDVARRGEDWYGGLNES